MKTGKKKKKKKWEMGGGGCKYFFINIVNRFLAVVNTVNVVNK